jgi:hypothetical protein
LTKNKELILVRKFKFGKVPKTLILTKFLNLTMKIEIESKKVILKILTNCKVLINYEHTKIIKLEKQEIRGASKFHNAAIKNGDLSSCRVCCLLE